jgi:hypothetical protein
MKAELTIRVYKTEAGYKGTWSGAGHDSEPVVGETALDAAEMVLADFRRNSYRVRGRGRGAPTLKERAATSIVHPLKKR